MKNYPVIGRLFVAFALIASGLFQLCRQEFVRLVPKSSVSWMPIPPVWATVSGAVLLAIGLAFAVDQKRKPAANGLVGLLVLVFLMYVPDVISNPGAGFMWTNPSKTLALLGGALLLAVLPSASNDLSRDLKIERAGRFSAICFGLFLVVCGVQHFVYADFVTQMVPAWMPVRNFWTYFTALALIAGGIGVNLRPTAGIAALLSGLMIFLWVVLLHIPRAVASWPDGGEISGILEALALSGTALLLVATRRNQPRLPGKSLVA